MEPLIVRNLTKRRHGGLVCPQDVSFEVMPGTLLALIGPSGSGKTTTLRLIAGLERPTAGSIRFGATPIDHLDPAARDIALVPQDAPLYPHLDVRRNLAFPLEARGVRRADALQRADDAAERLGLTALRHRLPATLSGGERQRVALGRALVRRPRLLLLDEPFAHLDPAPRLSLRAELRRLHADIGCPAILVTHDHDEATALAAQLAVMRDGVLRQTGPVDDVLHRPAEPFVASFVGAPPFNIIRGQVVEPTAGGLALSGAAGSVHLPLADRHRGCLGNTLALAIHPDDIVPASGDPADALGRISADVACIERQSRSERPVLRLADGSLLLAAPGRASGRVTMTFSPARARLFIEQPEVRPLGAADA